MQGLLGRKVGMTRVFDAQGHQVPVTVIACGPCVVLQRKTAASDGYEALQLGFEQAAPHRVTRAEAGVCRRLNVPPARVRREVAAAADDAAKAGDVLTVEGFAGVSHVDVTALSKGKGFQGVMRRHRMAGGPITHGGHSKRRIGSIGCRELPGRIHKGKRMPGHMGMTRVTVQNLVVVQVRPGDHALLVRGAVPGPANAVVLVRKSLKRGGQTS